MRRSALLPLLLSGLAASAAAQPTPLRQSVIADLPSVKQAVWQLSLSPDGRLITFTSGIFDQWLLDRQTGTVQRIETIAGRQPTWSPTGRQIVFTRIEPDAEVWTAPVSGTNVGAARRVSVGSALSPVYSPDGSQLAYTLFEDSCPGGGGACERLVIISSRGGEAREVTRLPKTARPQMSPIGWSRDGWIYFAGRAEAGRTILGRVRATGGSPQILVKATAGAVGVLSPDDRYIPVVLPAAASSPDVRTLVLYRTDGSDVFRRELPAHVSTVGWSATADRLIGVRTEPGSTIWTMPVSGGVPRLIGQEGGEESNPQWSPDGRRITFRVRQDGARIPAITNADGSGRRIFADAPPVGPGPNQPQWSPDGRWLAYRSPRVGGVDVVVLDVSTGRTRIIATTLTGGRVGWRSDSRGVIYRTGRDTVTIVERMLDGGAERLVATVPRPVLQQVGEDRAWAFVENNELRLMHADGRTETLLRGVRAPVGVSSDLRYYAGLAQGSNDRMLVGGAGRNSVAVELPGFPDDPCYWHPDGSRFFMVVTDFSLGNRILASVPSGGGPAQRLPLPQQTNVEEFDLSPDGSTIVYSAQAPSRQTLVEILLDGLPGR